jgi:erythromycin esterase-like protein
MRKETTIYQTLSEWVDQEAIPFSLESDNFNKAVDTLMGSLGSVKLLGFGEALHGGEEILNFRNRLFQRLVEAHGFSAIVIESSFARAQLTNEYVLGRGPKSYHELLDIGFGQGVGQLEANRELVEWMRAYNADPAHQIQLRF